MFAFRQYSKLGGRISKIDAPMSVLAGTFTEMGADDSAWTAAYRFGEDISTWDTPMLSPKLANQRFGIPGQLEFKDDIRQGRAELMHKRKKRELERMSFLSSVKLNLGKHVAGFGFSILGNMANPIDIGFSFVPLVGVGGKAAKAIPKFKFAKKLRTAISRGLITTDEALIAKGVPMPKLTAAAMEGVTGAAIMEIPVAIQKYRDQAIYGVGDSLINIASGGAFGGGIRLGIDAVARALGLGQKLYLRLTPEGREAAVGKAADQFIRDETINVRDEVHVDENMVRDRVAFDEASARQEAIRATDPDLPAIEAAARAQLEVEGSLGRADDATLIKIARDQVAKAEKIKAHTTATKVMRRLVERYDRGDRSLDLFRDLAGQLELIYDNLANAIPPYYAAGGRAGVSQRAAGPNALLYRQAGELAEEVRVIESEIAEAEIKAGEGSAKARSLLNRKKSKERQKLLKQKQAMLDALRSQLIEENAGVPLSPYEQTVRIADLNKKLSRAIEAERTKRVNQLIERKRADAYEKARNEIIAEQQKQGKVLPQKEIERIKVSDRPTQEMLSSIDQDLNNLKQEAGVKSDNELDQMVDLYDRDDGGRRIEDSEEPNAVDAARDCLLTKGST